MPTIIDSLLVTLGLDGSSFKKGKAEVDKGLKETGNEADKTGAKLKKTGKEGAEGFNEVAKSAAKFLAIIGGTMAVKRFAEQLIESSAALDRFSKNINQNASEVSAWSQAAELAGGSAEGLQGTMDMLSKSQTELQLTGQSGLIPYLSALGVSLSDAGGKARPVNEILLDLSDRFSRMDRTTANNMGRMMGIDQGTLQLLLKGRSEVELMIRRQKENSAVTKQQAEESSRLREQLVGARQSFEAFGRELLSAATPALERVFAVMREFGEWIRANKEFVQAFLTGLIIGLTALAAAIVPINLVALAVIGLAAAIALLYQDYQTWKRGGDSFIDWAKWKPGIDAATTGLKFLTSALEDVVYWFIAAWDAQIKFFKGDFKGAWEALKESFGGRRTSPSSAPGAAGAATPPAVGAAPAGGSAEAVAYFQAQGWSKEQAAGLAANIQRESKFDPGAEGDGGKAYGIGQWHPDRQAEFKNKFGKDIRGSTMAEQMAFMQYELTMGNEQRAGGILKGTKTVSEAAAAVSMHYERPADRAGEAMARGALATRIFAGIPGASGVGAGAGAAQVAQGRLAGPPGGSQSSVETTIGEVKVYTQATNADGIARDMGRSLDYLFSSQANPGLN